jgi:hypothetical protein
VTLDERSEDSCNANAKLQRDAPPRLHSWQRGKCNLAGLATASGEKLDARISLMFVITNVVFCFLLVTLVSVAWRAVDLYQTGFGPYSFHGPAMEIPTPPKRSYSAWWRSVEAVARSRLWCW